MRLVAALLLSITTQSLAAGPAREVWLPIAGRAVGGDGRLFLTTVTLTNPGASIAAVTLSYFPSATPGQPPRTVLLRVPARSRFTHVLGPELVPPERAVGALRMTSDVPIEASGLVHSSSTGATFQAVPREMAIGSGEVTRLRAAAPFRLYVVETQGHPLLFAVKLLDDSGQEVRTRRLYVSGLEQKVWNFDEGFASMEIRAINGSGKIIAAGSSTTSRELIAFAMELPLRPRHRLGWPEWTAYGFVAAALGVVAIKRRAR